VGVSPMMVMVVVSGRVRRRARMALRAFSRCHRDRKNQGQHEREYFHSSTSLIRIGVCVKRILAQFSAKPIRYTCSTSPSRAMVWYRTGLMTRLKVEPDLRRIRTRSYKVGSAKGGKKIVERGFVGDVDRVHL